MNATTDKLGGKTKQAIGKVMNNKELQVKGKVQEIKGSTKQTVKNMGNDVSSKMAQTSQEKR